MNKPNSNFFEYDIALITFRKPFKTRDSRQGFKRSHKQTLVRPICLPDPKVIPSDINKLSLDEDITIIGMGYIGKKGTTKENIKALKLQYAKMKRLSPQQCLKKYHFFSTPKDFDSIKGEMKYP